MIGVPGINRGPENNIFRNCGIGEKLFLIKKFNPFCRGFTELLLERAAHTDDDRYQFVSIL